MPKEVKTNLNGQTLGRKGAQMRRNLMSAAKKLLDIYSPVDLTPVAVAKMTGTSPASFYLYFDDIRDILYALASEASAAMSSLLEVAQRPWNSGTLTSQEHAVQLVERFNEIWDTHRQVLRFRNHEADRGDPRFEALRMDTYVPLINLLARQILAASPPDRQRLTLSQAFAQATVLHAAMERMASTDPAVMARGLGVRRINEALAHLIRLVFDGGDPQTQSTRAKPELSQSPDGYKTTGIFQEHQLERADKVAQMQTSGQPF